MIYIIKEYNETLTNTKTSDNSFMFFIEIKKFHSNGNSKVSLIFDVVEYVVFYLYQYWLIEVYPPYLQIALEV